MTQSVWHKDDIGQIAATLLALVPNPDFACGVAALANAVGAVVGLALPHVTVSGPGRDLVILDAAGREVLP